MKLYKLLILIHQFYNSNRFIIIIRNTITKLLIFLNSKLLVKFINKNNLKKIYYVYDLKNASLAYGDFINTIMLIKLMNTRIKTCLIIINSEFRKDHFSNYGDTNKINKRIDELIFIGRKIVDTLEVEKTTYQTFLRNNIKKSEQIFCSNLVFKRKKIYIYSTSLINLMYNNEKNFLFENLFFENIVLNKKLPEKYITIGLRHGYKTDPERNSSINELLEIIYYLKKKFHSMKIIIITNNETYNLISTQINIDGVEFSENYKKKNNYILEDAKIIINSSLYFSYSPSGVSIFPEFSKIPYFINVKDPLIKSIFNNKIIPTDYFFSKKKRMRWSTKNQTFVVEKKNRKFEYYKVSGIIDTLDKIELK
jgi:hypothetical protein